MLEPVELADAVPAVLALAEPDWDAVALAVALALGDPVDVVVCAALALLDVD